MVGGRWIPPTSRMKMNHFSWIQVNVVITYGETNTATKNIAFVPNTRSSRNFMVPQKLQKIPYQVEVIDSMLYSSLWYNCWRVLSNSANALAIANQVHTWKDSSLALWSWVSALISPLSIHLSTKALLLSSYRRKIFLIAIRIVASSIARVKVNALKHGCQLHMAKSKDSSGNSSLKWLWE